MINQLEKVRPRINHFDHTKYPYYVYVYLNPFKRKDLKYKLPGEYIQFAYEPIYIGKASNSGFRHNQHIAEFIKSGSDSNNRGATKSQLKKLAFQELDKQMKEIGHTNIAYPRNWQEYQRDWVIVIKALNNSHALQIFEKRLIQTVGTLKRGTGPLTNILLG